MYQNNMLNSRVVLRYSAGQLTGAIFAVGEYLVREDAVAKKTNSFAMKETGLLARRISAAEMRSCRWLLIPM
jgi:hypothetical protein